MQACTCHWIIGAFHTSPLGVVKTLAGIPPIHLYICKPVERSNVCLWILARSHSAQLLVWGDHSMSMANLTLRKKILSCSPITETWANQDLCTDDGEPYNEFSTPGDQIVDWHPDCIVYNITLLPRGKAGDVAKFQTVQKATLEEFSTAASTTLDQIALIWDASKLDLPLQAIAAWHVWRFSGKVHKIWYAGGLDTSDDIELLAISETVV